MILATEGGVTIDPALLASSGMTAAEVQFVQYLVTTVAEEVAARRPPGMGIPWYSRHSDAIVIILIGLFGLLARNTDLKRIYGKLGAVAVGASPAQAEVQGLTNQLATARREITSLVSLIDRYRETERRAAQRDREADTAAQPLDRLGGAAEIEGLEARGRRMMGSDYASRGIAQRLGETV